MFGGAGEQGHQDGAMVAGGEGQGRGRDDECLDPGGHGFGDGGALLDQGVLRKEWLPGGVG